MPRKERGRALRETEASAGQIKSGGAAQVGPDQESEAGDANCESDKNPVVADSRYIRKGGAFRERKAGKPSEAPKRVQHGPLHNDNSLT